MPKQSKGLCKYCGKEYTKGGMLKHLAACKERKNVWNKETGKRKSGYFELVISGRYNTAYWLIIEMRDTATLEDLDRFLREIWVECCGHLSAFTINGEEYEVLPDMVDIWGGFSEPSKSMDYKLKDVFSVGMSAGYVYDFGSTTELAIKVQEYRTGVWKSDAVTILSRNNPPEILCSVCEKNKAVWILPERYYEGDPFRCDDCLRLAEEDEESENMEEDDDYYFEEFYLPVCNSPRMGVCGYEGSDCFPDVFKPDRKADK